MYSNTRDMITVVTIYCPSLAKLNSCTCDGLFICFVSTFVLLFNNFYTHLFAWLYIGTYVLCYVPFGKENIWIVVWKRVNTSENVKEWLNELFPSVINTSTFHNEELGRR